MSFYFNPSTGTTNYLTNAQANALYLIKTGGNDNVLTNVSLTGGIDLQSNINSNGSIITPIELSYLDGLTSNIQTQINNGGGGGSILSTNNIFTGTNEFTNNILVNGSTLTPIELSYLDGTTSNIQTQINNTSILNTNNIFNGTNQFNANILVNGQIITPQELSYLDNASSNLQNQLTSTINNTTTNTTDIINLNSKIENLPIGFGSGDTYYLNNTTQIINSITYFSLNKIPPNSTQQSLIQTINNLSGNVLLGSFITDVINKTTIDAGIYEFNLYASISDLTNITKIYCIVSKINTSFTKTALFTLNNGNDIQSLTSILYSFQITQPQYNINIDDKLIVDFYCNTTNTINTTITINYNSSSYFSNIRIPLITTHNMLNGLNDGEYQHLTNTQKNNIMFTASTNNNGYLNYTDWNSFNNKQSTITTGTISQYIKGDLSLGTFDKTAIGLSNVDNTTDINKPISSLTQTALNLKQNSITTGTISQYLKGDLSLGTLDKNSVGLSNVSNFDFTQPRNGIIYVNGLFGLDTNDGLSLRNAYKTISAAFLNTYISSGFQIQISPGTYTETITISTQNLSIVGTNSEIGGIVNLTGVINITSNSTSIRLCCLTMNNLTLTGSANLYIKDCNINGNFTKNGTGYLSQNSVIYNSTSNIFIQAAGTCNLYNGCSFGSYFLVNNASALVVVMNCLNIAYVVIQAGICSILNTVIYSYNSGTSSWYGVNCFSGAFSYISNCAIVNYYNNTAGNIRMDTGSYYSFDNINYDNINGSPINGTNLNRKFIFDSLYILNDPVVSNTSTSTLTNKTLTNCNATTQLITDNTTKIASTAYVNSFVNSNAITAVGVATLTNKTLTDCICNTQLTNDNSTKISSTAYVNSFVSSGVATLTNKTLTDCIGNTQLTNDNSTKLATTAFVKLFAPSRRWSAFSATSVTFGDGPSYTMTMNLSGDFTVMNDTLLPGQTQTMVYGYIWYYSTHVGGSGSFSLAFNTTGTGDVTTFSQYNGVQMILTTLTQQFRITFVLFTPTLFNISVEQVV